MVPSGVEHANGSRAQGPTLHLRSVKKTFGASTVLNVEDVRFFPGKVYGLLGANGSGKSTLVKILSGFHLPDAGSRVELRGEQVKWPLRTGRSGISVVQQEYALCDSMTVLDNFLAVRARRRRLVRLVRWKHEKMRAEESLALVGLNVDTSTLVASLSASERALLSIGRTIEEFEEDTSAHPILILDEPTANLGHQDVERVLRVMREFADRGGVVICVNHRLPEVRAVADDIVVLRDGKVRLQTSLSASSDSEIVTAMFGEMLTGKRMASTSTSVAASGAPISSAITLEWPLAHPVNPGVTIDCPEGRIIGFTGLVGMGQDELPYQLFGTEDRRGLKVRSNGVQLKRGARAARKCGFVLVPGERVRDGLWLNGSVAENFSVISLGSYSSRGRLARRRINGATDQVCRDWGIVASGPDAPMWSLSGGNQQKLAIARAVASEPWGVLLVHEPTQGIDVAARKWILSELRKLSESGKTILLFSADYESLAEVCDTVYVLYRGKVSAEVSGTAITEDYLAEVSMTVGQPIGASHA